MHSALECTLISNESSVTLGAGMKMICNECESAIYNAL